MTLVSNKLHAELETKSIQFCITMKFIITLILPWISQFSANADNCQNNCQRYIQDVYSLQNEVLDISKINLNLNETVTQYKIQDQVSQNTISDLNQENDLLKNIILKMEKK